MKLEQTTGVNQKNDGVQRLEQYWCNQGGVNECCTTSPTGPYGVNSNQINSISLYQYPC
jgi:hypothetical protein